MSTPSLGIESTGVWYCPTCGYVDPQTRATTCRGDTSGWPHPPALFVEALRGNFLKIPVAAASDAKGRGA